MNNDCTTMWVVAYSPETGEEYLRRELGPDEIMDERAFADEIADQYGVEIDESTGVIPNCCGDLRVEFRRDPENEVVIFSGESFYFERE